MSRRSTGWTDAQKGDVRNYEPGMVVDFTRTPRAFNAQGDKGGSSRRARLASFAAESRTVRETDAACWLRPSAFEVFRTREIAIGKGDRIRITKNGEAKVEGQAKGTRLNNGDIFTVEGFTKEGDIRLEKGKLLPKNWGHLAWAMSIPATPPRAKRWTGYSSRPATNRFRRLTSSNGTSALRAAGKWRRFMSIPKRTCGTRSPRTRTAAFRGGADAHEARGRPGGTASINRWSATGWPFPKAARRGHCRLLARPGRA